MESDEEQSTRKGREGKAREGRMRKKCLFKQMVVHSMTQDADERSTRCRLAAWAKDRQR